MSPRCDYVGVKCEVDLVVRVEVIEGRNEQGPELSPLIE